MLLDPVSDVLQAHTAFQVAVSSSGRQPASFTCVCSNEQHPAARSTMHVAMPGSYCLRSTSFAGPDCISFRLAAYVQVSMHTLPCSKPGTAALRLAGIECVPRVRIRPGATKAISAGQRPARSMLTSMPRATSQSRVVDAPPSPRNHSSQCTTLGDTRLRRVPGLPMSRFRVNSSQ